MRAEELTFLIKAQPFRPFRIHLADGRRLDIHHREFVAHSPSGRSAIVYKADDTYEVIDVPLVISLEILNGARVRKRRK